MGVYKKAIITDAGEALRARAVAGEANMQFSCAKTSTYVYPEGADLTKLTDLQEIRQTVVPSNVQITNDTLISVRSLFGNEQISEAYLIQNVGVYATDGENEILFAVCQAITPDQMPAYDGVAPSSFIYNVQLTVSQAAQISLVVNTAGTATTQDVLELEQKKVNGNGGDISETVIAATEKSQAEYPVPAAGDSAKTVLGKVQKFFADIRNWMTGVCLLGQIVNNCVTDNAKLPLSAAQGKALMDLYNVLNTKASKTGHTHDDRYYTETEINSKLNALNVNTDINFSLNGQSSCISHVSAYGKKTGKGTSIGYINYIFYIETDLNVWTRYKIFTLPYYATCAFGFAIDQDNGVCFLVEIESGSKDVYLTVQGTALKSGKWLRGQTVFVCW